jgi:hypothetical protein
MICQGPRCGKVFTAKRRTAKFCSTKCSVAASRAGELGTPTPADGDADAAPGGGRSNRGSPGKRKRARPSRGSRVYEETLRTLRTAGKVDTYGGQVALVLAERLDAAGGETLAALATAANAHAAAVDRALAGDNENDPVAALERSAAERPFTVVK